MLDISLTTLFTFLRIRHLHGWNHSAFSQRKKKKVREIRLTPEWKGLRDGFKSSLKKVERFFAFKPFVSGYFVILANDARYENYNCGSF